MKLIRRHLAALSLLAIPFSVGGCMQSPAPGPVAGEESALSGPTAAHEEVVVQYEGGTARIPFVPVTNPPESRFDLKQVGPRRWTFHDAERVMVLRALDEGTLEIRDEDGTWMATALSDILVQRLLTYGGEDLPEGESSALFGGLAALIVAVALLIRTIRAATRNCGEEAKMICGTGCVDSFGTDAFGNCKANCKDGDGCGIPEVQQL